MRSGALSERPFRLLLLGQGVSAIGDGIVVVALAFAVLDLTGSVRDLGFVLAAQTVPLVLFVLVGGVWSDRLPRRAVMLGSDLARAGAQGGSAVLLLTHSAQIWQLAVLQAAYGTARAFFGPAASGVVPQTVGPENLQQANGLMAITENVAEVIGPAVAGVLLIATGPGWGLAFDAATFLVSAASLKVMRLAWVAPEQTAGMLTELREGWRGFRSRTWLWVSVASFVVLVTVVFAPLDVLGPQIARASLGGAPAWAAINIALGLGAILGGAVGIRWRPRYLLRAAFLVTLIGDPALLWLLAGRATLPLILVASLLTGMTANLFNVFWFTSMQREVPAGELSRVSSWDHLGTYALKPVGLAVVGPIAVAIGVSTTLFLSGVVSVVLTSIVLAVPAVRNFTTQNADVAPGGPEGGPAAA